MEEMKTTAAEEQEAVKETAEVKPEKTEKKKTKKSEAELAACRKELEAQTEKCKEYEDRYLRMMAEYDNFRKRSAKEKEGVWADAYADCIANLLPILDNLERAEKCDNLDGLKKGLEMTSKAFDDALAKMGITEIETKTFDPNLHNAVMHIEDESFGESEIVEVFQKGYVKGDKVIRYAMVKVAN
ncbi:MAG: nucleotide exchange factor GrpE [Clostridia bacterium]|nr:nucleotide exchange factor GrpE [Clostridia bacterium]